MLFGNTFHHQTLRTTIIASAPGRTIEGGKVKINYYETEISNILIIVVFKLKNKIIFPSGVIKKAFSSTFWGGESSLIPPFILHKGYKGMEIQS